ncbi:MAG: hypothetical protein WEA61_10650 [Anaerolineales bacterium]
MTLASATATQIHIPSLPLLSNGGEAQRLRIDKIQTVQVTHSYLARPIFLDVKQESSGQYIAQHGSILTHGYGASVTEAALDFIVMMRDLRDELAGNETELAEHLKEDLEALRSYLIQ